jgi:hypothetical protein
MERHVGERVQALTRGHTKRHLAGTATRFLIPVFVSAGTAACAPNTTIGYSASLESMSDSLEFDFTEEEMYAALRLVAPDAEARDAARAFAHAHRPGLDWGTSERTLLLLSLATDTGADRVERLRRAEQESQRSGWVQDAQRRGGGSAAELTRAWQDLIAAEDRAWAAKGSELRHTLTQEGKLPPS